MRDLQEARDRHELEAEAEEKSSNLKLSTYYTNRRDPGTVYPVTVDSVSPNGVTGVLAVTFTEPTHASVRTEGHVNDDLTILTYRGTEFLVHVHVYLKGGKWVLGEDRVHATRRDNWSDATPTQASKLAETVLAVMNAYADTPEFVAARNAGTEKYARFDLESAQRKVRELEEQLKAARAEQRKAKRAHEAALDKYQPPAEPPAVNPFKTRGPQS
jgi:hypothetical protein